MRRSSILPMVGLALLCFGVATAGCFRRKRAHTLPRSSAQIAAAARARGMTIPPACEAGVAANLTLLAEHAARLRG